MKQKVLPKVSQADSINSSSLLDKLPPSKDRDGDYRVSVMFGMGENT